MNKMCIAHLGVLLLVLQLFSTQVVQAQHNDAAPMNYTMSNYTMSSYNMSNYTMAPTPSGNITSKDKNGCGRTDAFTLLLPLALAASLLHGWS